MATQEPHEELPKTSADEWVALLYKELRAIARRSRLRVSSGDTLQTTALINEAYTQVANGPPRFGSRGEFLRYAALAMRHILIDRVREQLALKRGGGARPVPLDEEDFAVEDDETVLAVHESLERLAAFDPRLAEIVQCRYFAGYDEDQTAEALGISTRTVQRDWATARAWLKKDLSHPSPAISTE
jgi:RNA polymerase sigma factor (TIGR02999 family)